MILVGIDTETTGPDPEQAFPVEVAVVVKELGNPRPILAESTLLYDPDWGDTPIPSEATAVHGISNDFLRRHARSTPGDYFQHLFRKIMHFPEFVFVAHNAAYDRRVIERVEAKGIGEDVSLARFHWLCTLDDVEHPHGSRKLGHLASDHGFLNPFPHTALADVLATLRILEAQKDFERILERSKSPAVVVRALCSYAQKDSAKNLRFRWEQLDGKTYEKCWVKRLKECDFERERAECQKAGFELVKL